MKRLTCLTLALIFTLIVVAFQAIQLDIYHAEQGATGLDCQQMVIAARVTDMALAALRSK